MVVEVVVRVGCGLRGCRGTTSELVRVAGAIGCHLADGSVTGVGIALGFMCDGLVGWSV